MKIEIATLDDDAGDELNSLRQWLRDNEDLRSVRFTSVTSPPAPGEMTGGVVGALEAAIVNKELLVALTSAIGGWLASRASSRRTRIRLRSGEREVEIDTVKVHDADQIAHKIWRELDEEP
jgi:hypothetical protein